MCRDPVDHDVLDLACLRYTGRAASDLDWRDLLTVRDAVDRLLSREIDRRQLLTTKEGAT